MLLDPDDDESPPSHAQRLRERFVHRAWIAGRELDLTPGPEPIAASEFALADLEHGGGWVATDVLLVLKQAHLDVHDVEHRRSQSVRGMLARSKADIGQERQLLRRSIVFSTLSLVASQVVPWAFAANADERKATQDDPAAARERTDPADAMWVARQITMLSLYRRAHRLPPPRRPRALLQRLPQAAAHPHRSRGRELAAIRQTSRSATRTWTS